MTTRTVQQIAQQFEAYLAARRATIRATGQNVTVQYPNQIPFTINRAPASPGPSSIRLR